MINDDDDDDDIQICLLLFSRYYAFVVFCVL